MPSKSKSEKNNTNIKQVVFMYGFDKYGFKTPEKPLHTDNGVKIEFIDFLSEEDFDKAHGVIIPQGIFEEITFSRYHHNEQAKKVEYSKGLLFDREKQVVNILKEGKWVCFLVGKIIDKLGSGHVAKSIDETDLCKRMLNLFGVKRYPVEGLTVIDAKASEFDKYIRNFGTAMTVLIPSEDFNLEYRILASGGNNILGLEFFNKLYFLPFHTVKTSEHVLMELGEILASSIFSYRQKRIIESPDWVNEISFKEEELELAKINELEKSLIEHKNKYEIWKTYKAILTTSGEALANCAIKILTEYFGLSIDPIDEKVEDAKIIDDDKNTLALIEFTGTKSAVQISHVSQVITHRDRNELPLSIPGILIINNEMNIEDISKRLNTIIHKDQIKIAEKSNILIIRTIDMLLLMRHLENEPKRKEILMGLVNSGGGWLKADESGYEIVTE